MKTLIILLCILVYLNFSDHPIPSKDACSIYTKVVDDPNTTRYKLLNKEDIKMVDTEGKMLFHWLIVRHESEFTFSIRSVKERCFEMDNPVTFVFNNGERIKLKTNSATNCKGGFSLHFGGIYNHYGALMELANNNIDFLLFEDADQSYKIKLKPEQSSNIRGTLDCMLAH